MRALYTVPSPWAEAMIEVGAVSPQTGRPSLNQLAKMADTYASTLSRMIRQDYSHMGAEDDTIRKVAKALRREPIEVASWLDIEWEGVQGEYIPPLIASKLSPRQRSAVDEMIKLLAGENE